MKHYFINIIKCIILVLFSVMCLRVTATSVHDFALHNTKPIQIQIKPVTYYIQPLIGNDANAGTSINKPFKTLDRIEKLQLKPGDKVVLTANVNYEGSLQLIGQNGDKEHPIIITSIDVNNKNRQATINFKGKANGILIQDCSYINITNIKLTANGYGDNSDVTDMRCAVLVNNIDKPIMTNILLNNININDVYYENYGFIRDKSEVKSANGTQKYGWGIRVINKQVNHLIENVEISNCQISNVSHTGIKLIGSKKNIRLTNILNNTVMYTGGPGIQMSEVQYVYVSNNKVDHSGSNNDSRKWGRGSDLWTWGSSDILIEKNQFLNANGPGDSDGCHIDYNCKNIIIQYNISANNAGGFCEILGNNYNSVYRYNISINDGYRVKGKDGAFQEGKILWLSGYQGNSQPRKGPYNTYIYNNTIYVDTLLQPKMAFTNTSSGVLIANNIFYSVNPFQLVLGDQNKADAASNEVIENMHIKSNLFLKVNSLPKEIMLYESASVFGNPMFKKPGGLSIEDYMPLNNALIKNMGMQVSSINNDVTDGRFSLKVEKDILGKPVSNKPSLGAIEPGN